MSIGLICLSASFLSDDTVTVGVEQFLQVSYLGSQLTALVCICHQHAVRRHLYNLGGAPHGPWDSWEYETYMIPDGSRKHLISK